MVEKADAILEQAREAKAAAFERLAAANRGVMLADGLLDTSAYAAMLTEVAPWIDEEGGRAGSAMAGLWQVSAQLRSNAVQKVLALAPSLYGELSEVFRGIVAECAAVPTLPQAVWSAPTTAEALAQAIRVNQDSDWAALTRIGTRWDDLHKFAGLLAETVTMQAELAFAGPTNMCCQFLN